MKKSLKNESVSFEEFFALAEFFDSVRNGNHADQSLDSKTKILLKADDYLQRGEKLMSLAKEHFKELVGKVKITDFEKLLYEVEAKDGDLLKTVTTKVIRPILRQAQIADEELRDAALAELLSFLCFDVELKPVNAQKCGFKALFRKQLQSGDSMLRLVISEKGYDPMVVYGLKCHTQSGNLRNRLYKSGVCVADIAAVLTNLVMLSVFARILWNPESDSYLDALIDHQKKKRNIAIYTGCRLASLCYGGRDSRLKEVDKLSDEEYTDACMDIWSRSFLLPEFKESDMLLSALKPLLTLHHVTIKRENCSVKELRKKRQEQLRDGIFCSPRDIPVIMEPDIVALLLAYDPFEFMKMVPEAFTYHSLLDKGTTGYWALPFGWETIRGIILDVFEKEYRNKHMNVVALNQLKSLDREYAKSYQTKKNIPAKTLASMEESAFNDYFGYVEFDEDVDLQKIAIVTEQFIAFKETYLPKIDSSDNAIRFRRLGNHKAAGLYYPSVKCLCVDINSPSSLVHEYGHLIDFCYGRLSSLSSFHEIRRMYEDRIRKKMENDKAFSGMMKGKGKYNLSYYLIPTEIFARAFEIYVKEALKVNNSLTPATYEAVYPTDEAFLNEITNYFNKVLPELGERNKKAVVCEKAAAK